MKLIIGARKSALSRIQAFEVGKALESLPLGIEVKYNFRETLGDVQLQQRLSSFGDRGVFTEDIAQSLITGEIDLAVHSWKDLPTAERVDTVVAATLPRADCRDVLLLSKLALDRSSTFSPLRILTCSPRREYNLADFLKWALPLTVDSLSFEQVRGNVETRIKKLLEGEAHGLVIAKAALDRVLTAQQPEFTDSKTFIREALNQCRVIVLPLSICPAAPAQGALAIEVLRNRGDLVDILQRLNHKPTFEAVSKERAVLSGYGGGCHQKIGVTVLRREFGEVTFLKGLTDAGEVLSSTRITGKSVALPRALNKEAVWPTGGKKELFNRVELSEIELSSKLKQHGVWVSKADALPQRVNLTPETVVWVAGLSTWKKLAARGVWVTGCAEGLGERESPNLRIIFPELHGWIKLTHSEGVVGREENGFVETIRTYDLEPLSDSSDWNKHTHFFWRSGSAFKRALEIAPEISAKFHGCGPGHTYDFITQTLGSKERVGVFLSFNEFIEEVVP